jgi:hypothetical protein
MAALIPHLRTYAPDHNEPFKPFQRPDKQVTNLRMSPVSEVRLGVNIFGFRPVIVCSCSIIRINPWPRCYIEGIRMDTSILYPYHKPEGAACLWGGCCMCRGTRDAVGAADGCVGPGPVEGIEVEGTNAVHLNCAGCPFKHNLLTPMRIMRRPLLH